MKTRAEHIAWCKERALEYVKNGDTLGAYHSMASDLQAHPETEHHIGMQLGLLHLMNGQLGSVEQMKHFIEGFS